MKAQEKIYQTLLSPYVSEKTTMVADHGNRVTFKVERTATKKDIKKSVEVLFKVNVESVTVLNVKGKVKLNRFGKSRKPSWKKAYVKLASGQDIDFTQVD